MSGSNKPLFFFMGLVLGLLAGSGFFIFKMDSVLKKVSLLNAKKDTITIQQVKNTEDKKSKTDIKKYIGQQSAPSEKDTAHKSMTSAEILAKKYSKEVPSKRVMAESDSLLHDVSIKTNDTIAKNQNNSNNYQDDNLVIKKDELIDSKDFNVTNLQQSEITNPSDSLLEKVSGIIDENKDIFASFNVEFWQSPINYKGYKMAKNKIVLFGLNPADDLKFFHLDDKIFMKYNQNYYALSFTDEFRQFEKVNDSSVLSRLEK